MESSGDHNVANALAAIAAARHAGVLPGQAAEALWQFQSVKRRMELLSDKDGVRLYDDFAHHPTAIATTLEGLRKQVGDEQIIAVIEPRSNSMKLGAHREGLALSAAQADQVLWYAPPTLGWDLAAAVAEAPVPARVLDNIDAIVTEVLRLKRPGTHVVLMSNGGLAVCPGVCSKSWGAPDDGAATHYVGHDRRIWRALRAAPARLPGAGRA